MSLAISSPNLVVGRADSLQVLDSAVSGHPQLLGTLSSDRFAQVAANGHVVSGLAHSVAQRNLLAVADISSPDHPVLLGSVPLEGTGQQVLTTGNLVLVWLAAGGGVAVLDTSHGDLPQQLTTIALSRDARELVAGDGYLGWIDHGALRLVDLTLPVPQEVATLRYPMAITELAANDALLFLAFADGGVAKLPLPPCGVALPRAVAVAPLKLRQGSTVVLLDRSQGLVNEWFWDLGDGTTAGEPEVTHTYPGPGRYTVTLTVSNELGSDTTSTTVEVLPRTRRTGGRRR